MSHEEIVANIHKADHFLRVLGAIVGVTLILALVFTSFVSWSTSQAVIEAAESAESRAVEAREASEQRVANAREEAEERLDGAMECIVSLFLIPPDQRTDDRVTRVCPPDLIGDVRQRLDP